MMPSKDQTSALVETRAQVSAPPQSVPRGHIPALDGVRGTAALMVFVLHYGGGAQSSILPVRVIGTLIKFGWSGVSLFFVLSGFLISGILWNSYQSAGWWIRFYARRSLRIFPLYYLAILIAVAVETTIGATWQHLQAFWVYIFYLRDIPPLFGLAGSVSGTIHLSHFWSLAVEEQFYIIWPFVLGIFAGQRRKAMRLILFLWMLSFLFRIAVTGLNLDPYWSVAFLPGRCGELLAGAYLTLALRGDAKEVQRLYRLLPIASLASFLLFDLAAILPQSTDPTSPLISTLGLAALSIFFASVIGLSLRPGVIQSVFSLGWLRWFGKISYGIYVYHLLFKNQYYWIATHIAPHASDNAQRVILFLIAAVGTLVIAPLSYYTFESVFLRWKDQVDARRNHPESGRENVIPG
jgi:peptidoglycan/LPS O-acetylase OafA/YrhL